MGVSFVGVSWLAVLVIGIYVLIHFEFGTAVWGWPFFMWPGLGIILFGDDIFYKLFGLVFFLVGAIPSYIDIKEKFKK